MSARPCISIELNWEHYLGDMANYLTDLLKLVEFARQHGVDLYYHDRQLADFTNIQDIDDNFIISKANVLDLIVRDAHARNQNEHTPLFSVVWAEENSLIRFETLLPFRPSERDVGVVDSRAAIEQRLFLAIESNTEFYPVNVSYLRTNQTIRQYLRAKAPQRNFNVSQKHGENGVGNWAGESVLRCSRARAQLLLDSAIPDVGFNKSRLFNYDTDHNQFVEFFFEGNTPQNTWHGFHVEPEHQAQRIPPSIRRFFV